MIIHASPEREILLIKLGGSLLTDKTRPDTARPEVIRRIATELADLRRRTGARLVVGHGSGSFGHSAAAQHGIASGTAEDRSGVSATQAAAARLHRLVVEALLEAGAEPFSLSPSSLLLTRFGLVRRFFLDSLLAALEQGYLPVIYGDVTLDAGQGAAIASTEMLFSSLAQQLPRRRWPVKGALWLGETAGLYDEAGKTIPRLTTITAPRLLMTASGASGTDVTGGVRLRIETVIRLAKRGIPSWILDGRVPGAMAQAVLDGKVTGTEIEALRRP